jgi:TPR repeat protein
MKKISLLTILLLGTYIHLNAFTFEENKKACDAGNAKGCLLLAFMYEDGQGVRQDYFKAAKLYTKACDAGEAKGCLLLAFMYEDGKGVRKDESIAKEYYGKACDNGDIGGCKEYKKLYEKGIR